MSILSNGCVTLSDIRVVGPHNHGPLDESNLYTDRKSVTRRQHASFHVRVFSLTENLFVTRHSDTEDGVWVKRRIGLECLFFFPLSI